MHYYKFNVGDYASHTGHLSLMEDLAYRRLLDAAYTSEKPLPKDTHALSRLIRMRDYKVEIEDVLNEFFEEVEEGWIHGRVLKEMEEAGERSDKAKVAAKSRWENKKHAQSMLEHCSIDATSIENNASSIKNDATQDPLHKTQDTLPIREQCPHEQIVNLYHEILPELPAVKVWNEKRKKLLQTRWREDEKRQDVDYWRRLFTYVSKSDFLMGRTNSGWQTSLEWMLNPSNFVKIIEGNYENRKQA
jgi:uncharacterized protein YdaU (DUF1376 family)